MASRPGSPGGRGPFSPSARAAAGTRESWPLCAAVGSEIDAAELRSVLDEEIDRLPAAFRRAVVLCCLEGKTQEDAARELGWTKGTVSGRLARAKELLRARLTRRGFAPSPMVVGTLLAQNNAKAAVPASLASGAVRQAVGVLLSRAETLAASGAVVALARWSALRDAAEQTETHCRHLAVPRHPCQRRGVVGACPGR